MFSESTIPFKSTPINNKTTIPFKSTPINNKATTTSMQTQTYPPTIKPASKAKICPQLYRYHSCLFWEKYGYLCPYSHSIQEARVENNRLFMERKKKLGSPLIWRVKKENINN